MKISDNIQYAYHPNWPQLRDNPHPSSKRGWIKCEDELPDQMAFYLALNPDDRIGIVDLRWTNESKSKFEGFTHWMDVNDLLLPIREEKKEKPSERSYTKKEILAKLKGNYHSLGMFSTDFETNVRWFIFLDQIEELLK